MGYSGFAIEVSPSADCVFALAMLIEKGAELYEEAGCTGQSPRWPPPAVLGAGSAPGDRAAAAWEARRVISAARWQYFGFGRWMDSGVKGGDSGSPNVDYLVLINWI